MECFYFSFCLFSTLICRTPVESSSMEAFSTEQPITSSGARMPQSPRRPAHQLPPRLNIHPAPTSELGPPAQVQVWWKKDNEMRKVGSDVLCTAGIYSGGNYCNLKITEFSFLVFTAHSCSSSVSGKSSSAHLWCSCQCCKSDECH